MILQLEEARANIKNLADDIAELGAGMGADALGKEIEELEARTASADFWNDQQESGKVLQRLKAIKGKYAEYKALCSAIEDAEAMAELADESDDESLVPDVLAEIDGAQKKYEKLKTDVLLSGEYDANNAILTFHPGAGGTEAQDWAQMLYRMYTHYAERHGFKYELLDWLDGDEAGIKSATILIKGENAYGYLKGESGIHRLVRVSPFDASGRRHTSFASVEVMPEFNDDIPLEIAPEDIKMEAHRASGAGGQHVNKTDSAVRITHIPTGIVVNCQTERSQTQNRETAMKMLKSKLLEIKEREKLDRVEDIKGEKLNIEWGSQIRSYVFMPYTLVKDNRTGCETGNIGAVMDGDLDAFIAEYLKSIAEVK